MNDAKSAPFAHIPYVKNPCIPPKISKSHNFGKLSEIRRPFPISHVGNWNLQNLQRIAQNSHNSLIVRTNHAKFTQSVPISQDSLLPAIELPKFAIFANFRKCSEFHAFRSVLN